VDQLQTSYLILLTNLGKDNNYIACASIHIATSNSRNYSCIFPFSARLGFFFAIYSPSRPRKKATILLLHDELLTNTVERWTKGLQHRYSIFRLIARTKGGLLRLGHKNRRRCLAMMIFRSLKWVSVKEVCTIFWSIKYLLTILLQSQHLANLSTPNLRFHCFGSYQQSFESVSGKLIFYTYHLKACAYLHISCLS